MNTPSDTLDPKGSDHEDAASPGAAESAPSPQTPQNIDAHPQSDSTDPDVSEGGADKVHGYKLFLFCVALGLVCFLVWLDEGILATVIPSISNHFSAFGDLAWYAPSYLFGLCAFQLPFGRLYKDFPTRPTLLASVLVFEVASIVQAAAPTSTAFIIGRVLAGAGGAGVLSGTLVVFTEEIPKRRVPFIMGFFSWVHGVGSIVGPVIGGAIASSSLTWRWCFYINPLLSCIALLPILFLWWGNILRKDARHQKQSFGKAIRRLDYMGALAIMPATVCLLLALQFGGSSRGWSDQATIALLVLAGFLLLVFVAVESWKGPDAMVPGSIAGRRVVALGAAYSALLDGAFYILVYYVPVWFQAIKGVSAEVSGYRILPLLVPDIVCNFGVSTLAGKLRYYHPFMALGSVLLAVGTGLLSTFSLGSSIAQWVVFQMIAGAGGGTGGQLPLIGVHDALSQEDVPVGYAVIMTAFNLGSSAALAIAQAVFASQLRRELRGVSGGPDDDVVQGSGATDLRQNVPPHLLELTLRAYNTALTRSWYTAAAMAGLSFLVVLGMKWKKMSPEHEEDAPGQNNHEKTHNVEPESKNV